MPVEAERAVSGGLRQPQHRAPAPLAVPETKAIFPVPAWPRPPPSPRLPGSASPPQGQGSAAGPGSPTNLGEGGLWFLCVGVLVFVFGFFLFFFLFASSPNNNNRTEQQSCSRG